jgi:hypothetical protein
VAIRNLPDDFLYKRIPSRVLSEDTRQLLRAVVGGFQDEIVMLRTLAGQIQQLWVPDNTVGEPCQVVTVTYADSDTGEIRTTTINVTDSTPDENASQSDLNTWCASEIGITSDQIESTTRTTDQTRTAETRTLQLLADTIGAKLYEDLGSNDTEKVANQKRTLKTYFSRIKVKGTALSFELLGRLHGFDDVRFTPLWGRLSPRVPDNVGSSLNDSDFNEKPQGLPTPGQPSELYDPTFLNDGDIYPWISGTLGIDENATDYLVSGVNGTNPYIKVLVLGAVSVPAAGAYFLKGGAFGKPASTDEIPNTSGQPSGFQFVAIADGNSFNGAQVVIDPATDTDGNAKIRITVFYNLSSIKFRTSYFNLAAAANYDKYAASNSFLAQVSPDLQKEPGLWQRLSTQFPVNAVPFSNGGIATDPFRYWTGGSAPQPAITTWPELSISAGIGSPTSRIQASIDTPAIDDTALIAGQQRFRGNIDDVRPATRFLRKFGAGLSLETDVQYAPHISRKLLASLTSVSTFTGSAGTIGTDYPTLPFTGSFEIDVTISGVTTKYAVNSETRPASPSIVDFVFVHPTAGSLLSFNGSFDFSAATYSVIVTAKDVSVTAATFYGLWQAIGTDRLQPEPSNGIDRHYQTRPEDELEDTYKLTFSETYPWRRPLVSGGEILSHFNESVEILYFNRPAEFSDLLQVPVEQVLQVRDEHQQPFDVLGVDFSVNDRGYVILRKNSNLIYGQRAIGFLPSGLISAVGGETLHGGPLSTITVNALGTPYVVGSVRGILVADPKAHWTNAHKVGLACWLHCGEHPLQPYRLTDFSDLALTQSELESGAFVGNYTLNDRVFDSVRGWVLSLKAKTADVAAGFIKITKSRLAGNDYTISIWLKVAPGAALATPQTILRYGPVAFNLSTVSSSYKIQASVINLLTGNPENVGNAVELSTSEFRLFSFAVSALTPDNPVLADVCATTNVSLLAGLPTIDGITLTPSMTILLTGQTNSIQNGYYAVVETGWYRIAPVESFDERLAYYQVAKGDSNQGIYQCTTNGLNPIVYGTDQVHYQKFNCNWGGGPTTTLVSLTHSGAQVTGNTGAVAHGLKVGDTVFVRRATPVTYNGAWTVDTVPSATTFKYTLDANPGSNASGTPVIQTSVLTQALFKPFQENDSELLISSPDIVGSPGIIISDARIWNIGKSSLDLWTVEAPVFKPSGVACRPTFFVSTSGAFKALQVTLSGYVFPSVRPIDFYAERYARAFRYNGRGEYIGPESRLQVGFGDAKPVVNPLPLGQLGAKVYSNGLGIAASTSSMLPGWNPVWYADATAGHYRRVQYPIANPNVDDSILVIDPASSFHPTELNYQNPAQNRIYVKGEDGAMYRVRVNITRNGTTDVPTLVAQLALATPYSQPSLTQLSVGFTTFDVVANVSFFDLIAVYAPDDAFNPEFVTDAETLLVRNGVGRLAVQLALHGPEVVQLGDHADKSTPPIFLYAHFQNYLDYQLVSDISPWLNQDDAVGVANGVPARAVTGPIILQGSTAQLDPGLYRVVIDAMNLGVLDAEFNGFDVEVSLSATPSNDPVSTSSSIVEAVLMPEGTPMLVAKFDNGSNSQKSTPITSAATVAEMQNTLDELVAVTGGVTILNTLTFPSTIGGPYYVQFNTVNAKPLFSFETTKSLSVAVTREIVGDSITHEVQKITLNRPMTVVEMQLTKPILQDLGHDWTLQIYLTNPRTTTTTIRRLAIHSIWIYRISSKLYKVEPTMSGLSVTPVSVVDSSTPANSAGGFRATVSQVGTPKYQHEQNLYAVSQLPGDTSANSSLPSADLLTGSTVERAESLLVQNDVALNNPPDPDPINALETKMCVLPPPPIFPGFEPINPDDVNHPTCTLVSTIGTSPITLRLIRLPDDEESALLDFNLISALTVGSTAYVLTTELDGANLFSSSDALNWTLVGQAADGSCLAFGLGLFIVGGGGGTLRSSPDGVTWTDHSSGTGQQVTSVTFGGGIFVGVCDAGRSVVSSNGTSWSNNATGVGSRLNRIAFGNSLFVAVGSGGRILTTTNGTAWTSQTSGTAQDLWHVVYGNGIFVAVGESGTVLTSPDGITWTPQTIGTSDQVRSVAFGNGTFYAATIANVGFYSADGITWIDDGTPSAFSKGIFDMAYLSGLTFYGVQEQTI